ncbi:Superfamily II DNA and RNA helicase [Prevotellaceae bacterium MN60]|nr:Superfamily II DNA and RNA helicase [Prevotellaceae bacterium MN60]
MDIQQILNKLGISELNEMQQHAAEAILGSDGDVVLLSPTGTGKTLAYLLPLVQLIEGDGPTPQALVITPGRELALQSAQVLKSMGCGLRGMSVYGGRTAMDEHRKLKEVKPQIVFGTPGRLNDHLDKENISRYGIRYLIIDEFDKCLEMGFQAEMEKLIKSLPGLQRRILLSATNTEEIPQFVNMSKKGTLIDFLPEDEQTSERITLYEVHSPQKDKLDTLRQLLLSFGNESSIVFLNYRESVERVDNYLREQGFVTSRFHGGLEQRQREDALYRFSNGSATVLVSTDLASRGLDIPDIQNIIHYHMPESEDGYIHRVGRTARWDKQGRAFFILGPEEQIPEFVIDHSPLNIEHYEPTLKMVNRQSSMVNNLTPALPKMATLYIGKGKKDKISKGDIVGFLCKSGGLRSDEIGRIDVKDRYAYVAVKREKVRQVLRETRGEKIKGIKTIVEHCDATL